MYGFFTCLKLFRTTFTHWLLKPSYCYKPLYCSKIWRVYPVLKKCDDTFLYRMYKYLPTLSAKKPAVIYNSLIAGIKKRRIIYFTEALARRETHTTSSRIWTRPIAFPIKITVWLKAPPYRMHSETITIKLTLALKCPCTIKSGNSLKFTSIYVF